MPMPRTPAPPKSCAMCGSMMERKRFGKRLEDATAFARRVFCSLSCANSRDTVTRSGAKQRASQQRKHYCENCGAARNLDVHHLDADPWNNAPENLQTVCHSSHMRWHHAQRRNGAHTPGRVRTCGPLPTPFPVAWLDSVPSATRLSRRARKSSGGGSLK